jgi:beta-lactamase regulating signal transducer with metallopeptidase domain
LLGFWTLSIVRILIVARKKKKEEEEEEERRTNTARKKKNKLVTIKIRTMDKVQNPKNIFTCTGRVYCVLPCRCCPPPPPPQ